MIIIPDTLLLVPLKCSGVFWVMGSYSCLSLNDLRASPVAQTVKNLPAMLETWVRSLGWDPLEKGLATHPSSLAWRIPWTEEPGVYSP